MADDLVKQMRTMRPNKGESLAELMYRGADEIERLTNLVGSPPAAAENVCSVPLPENLTNEEIDFGRAIAHAEAGLTLPIPPPGMSDTRRDEIIAWGRSHRHGDHVNAEWLIWSNEHRAWWRPDACGYAKKIADAGRFTFADAVARCEGWDYRSGTNADRVEWPPEAIVPAPRSREG